MLLLCAILCRGVYCYWRILHNIFSVFSYPCYYATLVLQQDGLQPIHYAALGGRCVSFKKDFEGVKSAGGGSVSADGKGQVQCDPV
jgi:hypothetical protein